MLVKKLGGTLFSSAKDLNYLNSIIPQNMNNCKSVIIVSAFGKTTRLFDKAIYMASQGDFDQANLALDEIMNFHEVFLTKINNSNDELLMNFKLLFSNQKRILKGVSITKELTKKTRDKFLAAGEQLALLIIYNYARQFDDKVCMLDASNLFITDDNFGNAAPLIPTTSQRITSTIPNLFKSFNTVITQGFVGSTTQGDTTTMGIESSNLSAALIAYSLDTPELHIITDVEGIQTADPRLFSEAKHIESISYDLAETLAKRGLKLIYPNMIPLLKEKNIQAIYYSANNPEGNRTIIGNSSADNLSPIITHNENSIWLTNVNFQTFVSCLGKLSSNEIKDNIKEVHYFDDNSVNIQLHNYSDEITSMIARELH